MTEHMQIMLGRLQIELESELTTERTRKEWYSECLRVCARERMSLDCADYLADYLSQKHGAIV